MQAHWQHWLSTTLGDPGLTDFYQIQSLWNGYGTCCRFYSPLRHQHLVAKVILPRPDAKHPRGWQTSHSHQRKLQSYNVEAHFYRHYQQRLDTQCYAPFLVAHESAGEDQLLVLEDLSAAGFTKTASRLSPEQSQAVLKWLAYFHARFLQTDDNTLWQAGGYWHLATRQQEWEAMENGELKRKAKAIDNYLAGCQFKTLLHGDAKVANFCFEDDMRRCAAVDFQYTGSGIGVIDVAYFLGSALSESALITHTESCLEYYFTCLRQALSATEHHAKADAIINEWKYTYPIACADFCRFLSGWSPQHVKLNQDLHERTRQGLLLLPNE
ncbi:phosphotransferase [Alteromonas sp. H39]|uniref:phosphotransferase n=1 Tax=Alteromonas sp. H39 TaxID=3389876 RepID=UPI0039E1E146